MRLLLSLLLVFQLAASQVIKIENKVKLSKKVEETSGIVFVDNELLTFNDSGGKPELYVLNSKSGKIKRTIKITNATNLDWESITQDENYIYIGDTGNNAGNRKNLVVYKVNKADVKNKNKVKADKIYYAYEDQRNFKAADHAHNFDSESITIYQNQLLVFTKNWKDFKTNIYTVPTDKGTYIAKKVQSININCLLTSLDYNPQKNALIGTAYNKDYQSYLVLFKDFNLEQSSFLKIKLTPLLNYANQVEAIAWKNNHQVFVTREASKKKLKGKNYKHKQKLFLLTLPD
ncbi:hypothetical protein FHR24_002939 [Wenyingzhuangia heitensis]|uniref:Uncharacterized protein n=1 Tax=Wenyingzhuangia heitensis TaxID=1487859 RepID=A0ABX0UC93_9FLAO|nr:hypothetical protein [Wenyingzhuangia heitensis]NIJ46452.1 hypothetical protein [Wenyingzhuangia heitensis]